MKRSIVVFSAFTLAAVCFGEVVRADGFFGFGRTRKGSGRLATEVRDLSSFDRIKLEGSADVLIAVGKKQRVAVTVDDNLLDNIVTEVVGRRTLIITSRGSYSSSRGTMVKISVPELTRLTLSGSGDVDIRDLEGRSFEIRLDGSGDISVEGKVREVEIDVNGSGNVDTRDLIAREAIVHVNGSGDVEVYAEEEFEGTVHGSGDIDVSGDPERSTYNIHGSGSVRPLPALPALPSLPALPELPALPALSAPPAPPAATVAK